MCSGSSPVNDSGVRLGQGQIFHESGCFFHQTFIICFVYAVIRYHH